MSHIPNSAMPKAGSNDQTASGGGQASGASSLSKAAGKIADKARGNPKTAVAAGAAVVGAIAAAAAIPLVRGRKKGTGDSTTATTSGGTDEGGSKSE